MRSATKPARFPERRVIWQCIFVNQNGIRYGSGISIHEASPAQSISCEPRGYQGLCGTAKRESKLIQSLSQDQNEGAVFEVL